VTAPAAGFVLHAGPVSRHADAIWRRLGTIVVLAHDERTRTVYGHLAAPLVKKGQRVARGGPIGRVGTTGFAVTPRLHYEVLRLANGRWVPRDPRIFVLDVDWIRASSFRGETPPELPPLPISAH
jgi:murein DD-endopeptidase MepM/ murein hydrolase activator NlpD